MTEKSKYWVDSESVNEFAEYPTIGNGSDSTVALLLESSSFILSNCKYTPYCDVVLDDAGSMRTFGVCP